MPKTIAWTDGSSWTVDERTFGLVTRCLDRARAVIWGLDAIYNRWVELGQAEDRVRVDEFAPTEEDRAIVTAALDRAVEDARAAGPEAFGFESPNDHMAFVARLGELHQLFVTDVTHKLPRAPR